MSSTLDNVFEGISKFLPLAVDGISLYMEKKNGMNPDDSQLIQDFDSVLSRHLKSQPNVMSGLNILTHFATFFALNAVKPAPQAPSLQGAAENRAA